MHEASPVEVAEGECRLSTHIWAMLSPVLAGGVSARSRVDRQKVNRP